MRILVTGAGGFVGSVLCNHLVKHGNFVRGVDNFFKGQCDSLIPLTANPLFEFVECDITDQSKLKQVVSGIDAVVHLAALVGFPKCKSNPALARLVNEDGSRWLADAVASRDENIKFIFASTGSVYGIVKDGICTEETELNYQSLYGETKANAERFITERIPHALLYRFATGFGVGNTTRVNLLVNDLVYQAITNRCLTIFEPDAYRTFIHVKDMGKSFVFGLNKYNDMKHRIYNVGADSLNTSKRQLAEMISERTGCLVTYAEIGKDLDARDYAVSYEKIANEGWIPQYSLELGINELIKVTSLMRIKHQYD